MMRWWGMSDADRMVLLAVEVVQTVMIVILIMLYATRR